MKKPDNEKYKENMNITLKENQKEEMKKRAHAEEKTLSEYVRDIHFPE